MTIMLSDIWPIANQRDYKVHFARYNGYSQPLEVWARSPDEWMGWQEYRPGRNDFNRPLIFSLMQFYHENDAWLFGGVFRVLERHSDHYVVELTEQGAAYAGRLKLHSPYRKRTTRPRMENHYRLFEVQEILREPYSGRRFPGYNDINLSFDELETIVRHERLDWKTPLENIKGVYLISVHGRRVRSYVGAAWGDQGIWSRWVQYIDNGHGGNVALRELLQGHDLDYCRRHFRFSLLEDMSFQSSDEAIQARERHWKDVLSTRSPHGLNRN